MKLMTITLAGIMLMGGCGTYGTGGIFKSSLISTWLVVLASG